MPTAAKKAPLDFLFAIVVCLIVIGTSLLVDPPETKYVVLITGIVMLIAVLASAGRLRKPAPSPSEVERRRS